MTTNSAERRRYGGIAYRHIADAYIALFSHFIPCGVWEAVYIFEGPLENASEMIAPEEIHADTTTHILRFGDYVLDLSPPDTAVKTHLDLDAEANSLQTPIKE